MKDKNDTRLWLDITDLWYWSGSFTGIQNVVDNYSQAFIAAGNARLSIFEQAHRTFREVSHEEWQERRQAILTVRPSDEPDAPARRPLLRVAHHYAAVTAKRLAPAPVKRYGRKAIDRYRNRQSSASTEHRHPFRPGDEILVIGGSWGDDFRGYAAGLARIRRQGVRLYHVIHDVLPLQYPNYYLPGSTGSFERYFTTLAPAVDGYLAVSKASERGLRTFLESQGCGDAPVRVFRLGEDFPAVGRPQKPDLDIAKDFILCVGTIEARKNQAILYNVAKLALEKGIAIPQIVIAGRKGWMAGDALHHLTADPDLAGKVVVSHTVTDAEKAWLFKHCLFAVYPSFGEGWGLPIVEALHNGKLCLCANMSSMPEAGGDYVDYISPYDAGDVLEKIVYYAQADHRRQKEAHIATRQDYTWAQSFEDFRAAFDAVRATAGD